MSTEIWYLLFNNEKKLLGVPYKAEVRDIADLKRATEELFSELNVKAHHLVVWQCKEPTFLSTQDDDELQDRLLKIDSHNKKQVVKLVSGAKVASLGLGPKEVLLVEVPDTSSRTEEKQSRYFTEAQRATLALARPSNLNAFSTYQRLQLNSEQKILDDFPRPDLNIPPLALLYDGFGRFYDHIASAASSQTFHPDLKMLVDELVARASENQAERYI